MQIKASCKTEAYGPAHQRVKFAYKKKKEKLKICSVNHACSVFRVPCSVFDLKVLSALSLSIDET
jgi:hypothetical protein